MDFTQRLNALGVEIVSKALDSEISTPVKKDDAIWLGASFLPDGTSNKTPVTLQPIIKQYRSWLYVASKYNAQAVASTKWHLCAAKKNTQKMYAKNSPFTKSYKNYIKDHPLFSHKTAQADDIVEIVDHPFLRFMDSLNCSWNGYDAIEQTQQWLELCGNAYWYVVRNKFGVPVQFYVLQSHKVSHVPDYDKGGVKAFLYYGRVFQPDEILHFAEPSPLSMYLGYGAGHASYYAMSRYEQMEKFEQNLQKNAVTTSGIAVPDEPITMEQMKAARDEIAQKYSGPDNAGRLLFAPYKLHIESPAIPPEAVQILIDKKVSRDEILACFGLSQSMFDATSMANAYSMERQYARRTLAPRIRRLEEAINRFIIPMFQSEKPLFFAFDNPVPADQDFKLREIQAKTTSGAYTINDIRSSYGDEPIEGGDKLLNSKTLEQPKLTENDRQMPELPKA